MVTYKGSYEPFGLKVYGDKKKMKLILNLFHIEFEKKINIFHFVWSVCSLSNSKTKHRRKVEFGVIYRSTLFIINSISFPLY